MINEIENRTHRQLPKMLRLLGFPAPACFRRPRLLLAEPLRTLDTARNSDTMQGCRQNEHDCISNHSVGSNLDREMKKRRGLGAHVHGVFRIQRRTVD